MTHDKLLADINESIQYEEDKQVWKTLRAVVELHKEYVSPNIYDTKTVCMHCTQNKAVYYPCLTIKVIEKELN